MISFWHLWVVELAISIQNFFFKFILSCQPFIIVPIVCHRCRLHWWLRDTFLPSSSFKVSAAWYFSHYLPLASLTPVANLPPGHCGQHRWAHTPSMTSPLLTAALIRELSRQLSRSAKLSGIFHTTPWNQL